MSQASEEDISVHVENRTANYAKKSRNTFKIWTADDTENTAHDKPNHATV